MEDKIDNWCLYQIEGVSLELHRFKEDEAPRGYIYNVSVTHHIESDQSGATTKAVSFFTNIMSDCKYCAVKHALESLADMYDIFGDVLVFDESGENIEDIPISDCMIKCENAEGGEYDLANMEVGVPIIKH